VGALRKVAVAVEEGAQGRSGRLALLWASRGGAWVRRELDGEEGWPALGIHRGVERLWVLGCCAGRPTWSAGR
jgi:hypothetical protein